ncbi:hypothetical protein B0H34DRAFT_669933 [Crassisporium funariophilum]|nr:hypothetical protein B0H34DRAFT_669933 [Crassisporium funariophilum]
MARSKWISFGAQVQLDRAAKAAAAPATLPLPSSADAKKFGLENFGNTCYANSVLQALYFCTPFRELLLQEVDSVPPPDTSVSPVNPPTASSKPPPPLVPLRWKPERKHSTSGNIPELTNTNATQILPNPIPTSPPTLFSALRSLYLNISTNPGDKGTVAPRAFIDKLKELNELFRSSMHQDAHEFLNYLLNRIVEEIEDDRKQAQNGVNGDDLSSSVATLSSKTPPTVVTTTTSSNSGTHPQDATLVHKLFEGILTSETRCLTCETVSSRDESFLDLSIDIEQNSSVTACLRQFSASEMLCQRNKFFCDSCCDLQEAEKRMKIKKLPNVLALHLKRFKYQEDVAKYIKLAYRVAFPFELRLFNTVDDMDDADRLYNLFAIVVHIGNGPHHGHYISIIKTAGTWLVFDDDNVYPIPESDITKYFGDSNSGSAYVLYYQAVDIDLPSLGLRTPEPPAETLTSLIPPLQRSPALQSQPVAPVLPPGLNSTNSPNVNVDADLNQTYPPTTPSLSPLPPPLIGEKPPFAASPITITIPANTDISPVPSTGAAVAASPVTPSGFGAKFINTIRRAPSMSAPRGSVGSLQGHLPNGSEGPRSTTERSPRPSTSTPSFVGSSESTTPEVPPPLPPLPLSFLNQNQSPIPIQPTPTLIPQVNEPEKEKDKDKDRLKSTAGWFNKKRKSLRIGEKRSESTSSAPEVPPSPMVKGEDGHLSHMNWFKTSGPSINTTSPKLHRRPSEKGPSVISDVIDIGLHPDSSRMRTSVMPTGQADRDPMVNGYDSNGHRPKSASSSPGPNSVPTSSRMGPSRPSLSRPSTSVSTRSSGSAQQHDFPPVRKSTVAPPTADFSRASFERKKSVDLRAISSSPSNNASPLSSSHITPDYNRTLPPLPPTPKFPSHRTNLSNGHIFSEPESMTKGKARSIEDDALSPLQSSNGNDAHMRSTTMPPTSLAASVGGNHSTGSAASASSNIKRATRKLSLGFGKRDKDKDKEREKEREKEKDRQTREREKDRVSPNAYNRF